LQLSCGGDILVQNLDAGSLISMGLGYGTITFDATCVGGNADLDGIATLIDNSGVGCTINSDDLIDPGTVAKAALIPALV